MDHLMENCKNIEELHLGSGFGDIETDYLPRNRSIARIKFQNLRNLTLCSFSPFDGDFLIPVSKSV